MASNAKNFKGIFIVGCGDIGTRVARLWHQHGLPVRALARSRGSAEQLRGHGIEPLAGDLDEGKSLPDMVLAGHALYYFAPPSEGSDDDLRMANFVAALQRQRPPEVVVYLSTSGVYGDTGGAWVDEETPPNPQSARARRRLAAETRIREWGRENNVPVVVLRVGGIYGPGRFPIERLQKQLPVVREAECGYTNRIHTEDLAEICLAAAERGGADRIYNVSDGNNGTMTQYFKAVAARLDLPMPPEITLAEAHQQLTPAMLSYLTESRRMRNKRLCEELGVTLRFPDLETGLKVIG